ncbi:MAG: ABC transporter permease subunit [Dehalococcoidia bacterium]
MRRIEPRVLGRPGGFPSPKRLLRLPDLSGRQALTLILVGAFVWSALQVNWSGDLVHSGGGAVLLELLEGLARPDLSGGILSGAAEAAWTTVVFAVAGLSVALVVAIPLSLAASGVLVANPRLRRWTTAPARTFLSLLRSVHELVWAWLFVAAIGLSPFAAIFALAIPYAGILGRIYADRLTDVPDPPLRALRSSGAGETRVLLYGRLPMAAADLASYTFYRFECGLRSAAIMGFVGIGGLGLQIQLALDDLAYSQASTYLLFLIALIALVEVWSSQLRKRLVT